MYTKADIKRFSKGYGMTEKDMVKFLKEIHPEEFGLPVKKMKMPKMKINRKQSFSTLMKKMQSPDCSSEDAVAGAEALEKKAKEFGITAEELMEQIINEIR